MILSFLPVGQIREAPALNGSARGFFYLYS